MTEELVWLDGLKIMHAQTDWGTFKCNHKGLHIQRNEDFSGGRLTDDQRYRRKKTSLR